MDIRLYVIVTLVTSSEYCVEHLQCPILLNFRTYFKHKQHPSHPDSLSQPVSVLHKQETSQMAAPHEYL